MHEKKTYETLHWYIDTIVATYQGNVSHIVYDPWGLGKCEALKPHIGNLECVSQ